MVDNSLFSSETEEWATPPHFFQRLHRVFNFQLDVCATAENAKCSSFFTKEDDGLSKEWASASTVWMNPPYGKNIGKWMEKAYEESRKGCVVVCLVPARTDTRWWHQWVKSKANVIFVKGRLKFGGAANSAPFPSAVAVYGFDLDTIINQKNPVVLSPGTR